MKNTEFSKQTNHFSAPIIDPQKQMKYAKHRYMVLNQWIVTQKKYINDLKVIKEKIQQPMMDKNLITKEDQKIVFYNIDSLIQLSQNNLLLSLEESIKNWKPEEVIISSTLKKIHPFFKIYLEYCKNYQKGQTILNKITYREQYREIQKLLPGGLDINSYLIKPIQRPPKYILLLRDYRAKMLPSHPDYEQLGQVIKKYDEVIKINNQAMEKQSMQQKMLNLTKLYSGLIQRSRELLRQFNGNTLEYKIKIYAFTDMILITKYVLYSQQLYQIIEFDSGSYVRKQNDGKYYENIVFVCGRFQCMHIMFESKYEVQVFYKFISEIINNIVEIQENRKKVIGNKLMNQQVKVKMTLNYKNKSLQHFQPQYKISIVGVEKRPISAVKNQTLYIIKYELNRNKKTFQYVYTRFSILQQIYAYVNRQPNPSIPSLTPKLLDVNFYDQKKNKTKIIEFRTMLIIQFLNTLFRNPKIMMLPLEIIQKLKMNQDLFHYACKKENLNECCVKKKQHERFPESVDEYLKQRQKYIKFPDNQEHCIHKFVQGQQKLRKFDKTAFDTLEKIILCLDANEGRMDYNFLTRNKKQSYIVKIWYYNDLKQSSIQIKIGQSTTVCEIIRRISLQFNIKNLQDFGLFLDYEGIPRLLDQDEIVLDIIQQIEGEIQQIKEVGFMNTITQSMSKIKEVFVGKRSKLTLKKYFFLTSNIEKQSYHNDQIKYKFIIEQALYYIRHLIVPLQPQQLIQIVCYFIELKEPQSISYIKTTNFPKERVKKLLKQYHDQSLLDDTAWLQKVIKKIQQFEFNLKKKQHILMLEKKNNNIKLNKKLEIYDRIIDIVESKINWKSCIFPVTNHYPQTLPEKYMEVYIGVNYKHVYLIVPKKDQAIPGCIFQIQQFTYRVTPFSISFVNKQMTYRFDGRLLYNLTKLINRYQKYNQIFWGKKPLKTISQTNDENPSSPKKYF